ncbi:MAG: class I SAM-dependent rRNA methyltransferase [Bacilli bacterium]
MKNIRNFIKVTITVKGENSILNGHPWVYEGEVTKVDGNVKDGELVDVISNKEKYLGTGFFNSNSKIRIRIISRNTNDTFDKAFFKRRIEYAWNYRKTVMNNDLNCCRVIFGEADFLPGLTVDKFGSILVTQTLCLGIDKIKDIIFPLLYEVLNNNPDPITGIYERNDVKIRELEGLTEYKGFYPLNNNLLVKDTTTTIIENNLKYEVDFENGQKTGFFLDQKYNRLAIQNISKDKTVLDCFTHTGSFAMNAALGGAKRVVAVDISNSALEVAEKNIKLNNLEKIVSVKQADIFDLLREMDDNKDHSYDLIILDPPAFTKSRSTISSAMRGYKEINYRAMKLLPRGGYLVTASCSHFATEAMFKEMLINASHDAGVTLRQVEFKEQGPDHPILWNVPETNYLKFYIFQIV